MNARCASIRLCWMDNGLKSRGSRESNRMRMRSDIDSLSLNSPHDARHCTI